MRGIVVAVSLAVTLSASAAPAPLVKRTRVLPESIHGEWGIAETGIFLEDGETRTMVITGDRMTIQVVSGSKVDPIV